MKKQPYLTSFPQTVFANSARRFQAKIRKQREEFIKANPSGLCAMFQDILPASFLESIDQTQRQRHFGNIPIFWAWISQIIEGNSSCSKGLGFIQAWCAAHNLPLPSSDNSSFCKARKRLSDQFIKPVAKRLRTELQRHTRDENLWKGMTLKAIDGSTVKLMDTPANQETCPQPSSQKAGCGFPVMSVSGLLNLSHGGWESFSTSNNDTHDLTLAKPLLDHLNESDLLLADRAYCSYRFFHGVRERGAHVLTRLHQKREAALDWRRGRKISPHERIVTWKRPMFSSVSKQMNRQEWEAMPESMDVRLIRLSYEDRSGQKRKMIVVTTLTDGQAYEGIELHQMYARRWEIEVRLRDIKTTMGFEFLRVRTPEMALRTLDMIQIAYNLVRLLMLKASRAAGVATRSISFKGVLDLVTTSYESFRECASKPRIFSKRMDKLLELASQKKVLHRPFRKEPRAVKQRPKPFALLTKPRHEFIEIPHRSNYRACA